MSIFQQRNTSPASIDFVQSYVASELGEAISVTAADATVRKTVATYTTLGVTPRPGLLVDQSDVVGVVWLLTGSDVTLDANWRPLLVTENDGTVTGVFAPRDGTSATVFADGEIAFIGNEIVKGDGATAGGVALNAQADYGSVLSIPSSTPVVVATVTGLIVGATYLFDFYVMAYDPAGVGNQLINATGGLGDSFSYDDNGFDGTITTKSAQIGVYWGFSIADLALTDLYSQARFMGTNFATAGATSLSITVAQGVTNGAQPVQARAYLRAQRMA